MVLHYNAIRRTARRQWNCKCPGNGHQNCTHQDCAQVIQPGDRYIEYVGESHPYQSGTRYCGPCGEAEWVT